MRKIVVENQFFLGTEKIGKLLFGLSRASVSKEQAPSTLLDNIVISYFILLHFQI